ncbi:uncharacterized protein LOC108671526 [Hyalella azteca]|uniref:RNA-directed DNA polymerase n=1 Tax=Hyalella azteca TaxID=294128 RepID=A0A8B7NLM4_HYAAZ|nr:uncharacterized protein LOC108671526 [Hyalella azteca]
MKTKDSNASSYFVTAKINGQYFDALVDNGAAVSVISEELLTRMSPAAVVRPDSRTELRGFGNTVIPVLGDTTVNIEIEDLQASSCRIVVVPRGVTSRPLVLGLDFLEKHFMVIDTVNRLLLYSPPDESPHSVHLKTSCGLDVQTTVRTVDNVTILPHELKLIKVRLSDMCIPDGSEGYLEPFSVHSTCGEEIKVAYSLNAVKNGHIMVELLNVNPSEVQLRRKTKIGIFCVSSNLVSVLGSDGVGESVITSAGESGVSVENSIRVGTSDICAGDLFDFSKSDLSNVQIATVKCMLEKRRAAISLHKHDLGRTATARHVIDVQGNPPCKQRYRRFQGPLRHEIEEELRKLQDRDIIERSNSPWSSPLVPIRKKDGNLRLCVDYRALNSVTKRDSFPLPNMIDGLSNLNNTHYFSTFDLMQGFYQMEMDEASKEFTAFSTGDSHWQWKRMPFGLTNSPSSFMQLMALVLAGIPWSIAISYIDDVIITGSTFEDHLANCDLVLSRFEEHGLKVRPDKCSLFRSEVTYLGHTVGRDGVRPDRRNVQAILDFPQPKTQRQVRRYLGMVNFFRRHIPNASTIIKPLDELINQKKLSWTEECNAAFLGLKQILTNPPVLSFPDFSREAAPLIITVDASGVGAGAVLTQQQDGVERPLAYASTTFNQVEVNYSATERELAGLRWAVKTFRPFIYGRKYVIRTDHRALIYLNNMKSVDARLMRTYEELHCGQYEIQFVPGKENVVADALSRMVDLPVRSDQVPSNYAVSLQGYKLNVVPGGPDSLFYALALGISGSMDEHPVIREATVACVLKNPIKYGIGKAHEAIQQRHGAARQHRPATSSRRQLERPEVASQNSALGAFSVPPIATSEGHNFGEFKINLSGLADKIAAAIRQRADYQPSNVAANDETEEQREEPLSELEEDEQVSLEWEHLSDGLEEVLENYVASPDPVVDNRTSPEPALSSGASTVVPTTQPRATTRSQTRRVVEDLVKALTLNAGRESDFLRAADTPYSFTLKKGHPTYLSEDFELPEEFSGPKTLSKFEQRRGHPAGAAQDFELPEEFHFLARSSVSEGPDLSDHLDREMNSLSDRWNTEDEEL